MSTVENHENSSVTFSPNATAENQTSVNGTPWYLRDGISMDFMYVQFAFQVSWVIFISASNGLIIYAILRKKSKLLKLDYTVFIVGLAITDFLVGVAVLPVDICRKFVVALYWRSTGQPSGVLATETGCFALIGSTTFPVLASCCTIMLISVDRFISIRWPVQHKTLKKPLLVRTLLLVVTFTVVTVMIVIACVVTKYAYVYDPYKDKCLYNYIYKPLRTTMNVVFAGLPIFFSICCHVYVGYEAYKVRRVVVPTSAAVANRLRIAKGTMIILGAFIVCVSPSVFLKSSPLDESYPLGIEYLDNILVVVSELGL